MYKKKNKWEQEQQCTKEDCACGLVGQVETRVQEDSVGTGTRVHEDSV